MKFIAQLMQWHARLYDPNFKALKVDPRVFLVASHQLETPHHVVCRLIMENLYVQGGKGSARQGKVFDPRGAFVVQAEDSAWVWMGSKMLPQNRDAYLSAAMQHLGNLQKYERASQHVEVVEQGSEGTAFWSLFGLQGPPAQWAYDTINDWSHLFIDVSA